MPAFLDSIGCACACSAAVDRRENWTTGKRLGSWIQQRA